MTRVLVIALVVAATTPVLAQGDSQSADALFREGRRLMASGQLDEACKKFSASNDAEASVGALLNLGECEVKRQDLAAAWTAFRRAELLARATSDGERARFARTRMDTTGNSLGFVTVLIPPEWRTAPDLVVELDGHRLAPAELGPQLPLEPGRHEIRAGARGAKPFTTQVEVQANTAPVAVEIALEKESDGGGGSDGGDGGDGGDSAPHKTQKIIGISMTAAGAVALAVSVTLGSVARSSWNDVKACRDRLAPPCSRSEIDKGNSARTTADVSTGFFVAGAIIAGAGIAVWATSGRKSAGKSESAPAGAAVSVAPVIDGESIGVLATGRF